MLQLMLQPFCPILIFAFVADEGVVFEAAFVRFVRVGRYRYSHSGLFDSYCIGAASCSILSFACELLCSLLSPNVINKMNAETR